MLLASAIAACGQPADVSNAKVVASGLGPHLAVGPDGSAVVSYIASTESGNALRYRVLRDGEWGEARTVAEGQDWFVNWADFPSVEPVTETLWAAHWLVRRKAGGYAYDVHVAVSENAGKTWSEPFLLHNDGMDAEHGFVSLFPAEDGVGAVWLDGRNMVAEDKSPEHHSAGGMTLRTGRFDASGAVYDEQVIDELTCDCCQTDIAITQGGPVVVYRDRTTDEVRDIYVSRFADDAWQQGEPVNNDGWTIPGCPVNGPVASAHDATLAVTWFTSADETPTVKTAWSQDSGQSFGAAVVIADENVIGYVGATLVSQETAAISWLCKVPGKQNAICYRTIQDNGELGPVQHIQTHGVVSRMSVPQLAKKDDQLLFVWTEKIDDQFQIYSATVALPASNESQRVARLR